MMPRLHLLIVATATALAVPWGGAAGQAVSAPEGLGLTRQVAIDSALARNPQLRVALEQAAEARARAVETAAFPDPTVSANLTPGNQTPGSSLGAGVDLPFPTKFLLLRRMGEADIRAADWDVAQLRGQIASQTAQAYDALLVALRHRTDLVQGDSLAREFLAKTEARFEVGSAPRLDVIKAHVDLAQAENTIFANERDITNARAALNRLLGRLLGAPLAPADTLAVPATLPPLDTLEVIAAALRPELRGLASQRSGAGAAASLAQAYWLPDVNVGVLRNAQQGSPTTYTTTVGFTVPLFLWNHQRGAVAEARHHVQELDASYADLVAQVDQDVRTSYATAATALEQAGFLRSELVPEAREAFAIALVSYGLGGSSALEVLDARRTLLDAESQYADALGAANDARADLERAVGTSLDALEEPAHDR